MLPILFILSPLTTISVDRNLTIHVRIDLPASKRRRTLAGSIVSTAISAAIIGTAVGITVYRLSVTCSRDFYVSLVLTG